MNSNTKKPIQVNYSIMEKALPDYKSTEKKWFPKIEKFFQQHIGHTFIPSHDFNHHKRTWFFAKQLIATLQKHEYNISPLLIEQTMWACMFHDIGMSITISPKHGEEGVRLFKQFVDIHQPRIDDIADVYYAIENHDDKTYLNQTDNLISPYHILTIADDLDAFGHIGVYRFIEIQLLRKTHPSVIHQPVLSSLQARFDHFSGRFNRLNGFFEEHKNRYQTASNFFKTLQDEVETIGYKSYYFIGAMGVLNYLNELVLNRANPFKLEMRHVDLVNDQYLVNFFREFLNEAHGLNT